MRREIVAGLIKQAKETDYSVQQYLSNMNNIRNASEKSPEVSLKLSETLFIMLFK